MPIPYRFLGFTALRLAAVGLATSVHAQSGAAAQKLAVSHAPSMSAADQTALVKQYCATCHSDRAKAGGLSLASFDASRVQENADVAERIVRKLRAGMMPPQGAKHPGGDKLASLVASMETRLDEFASSNPNPGRRTFQRLNRPEYQRAVRELLGLEIDPSKWLPLDQKSAGFDNIADEQALSPTLLESYLNAAADISRMAVGDRAADAVDHTYTNPSYVSQHPWDHVEGAPFGTRGGMVVEHVFPADGEYEFELLVISGDNARGEDIDISIDGERVALVKYENGPAAAADGRGGTPMLTEPILVRAGQHKVSAAFVRRVEGPYEDLIRPHEWSYAGGGSGGAGITTLPHLRDVIIRGPYGSTGVSESPSRRKIFTCRPTAASEERGCARDIITRMASEAYRRPVTRTELDRLMPFYDKAASERGFEQGVREALEAVLASPYFVFRMERETTAPKGGTTTRIADVDLASRLSFFLWGTPPDRELLDAAASGKLATVAGLERQARRMLADPRADALGTRFAGQWLRLQDIDKVRPDTNFFPNFDDNIALAMRRETETFFNALVREDRSLMDLFTADYTYVNERLARHYGFPGVAGAQFRKVAYPDATRRGILGHGSVLVQTSLANRTSPVLRGKWVMETLLGTPPPPPPPNIPALDETEGAKDGKMLTTRERMEIHRANATCNACHRFMDPIGLALDNFDVTGKYRVRENGMPLDTRGDFFDGSPVNSLNDLVAALVKRPEPLVRNFTENLFAYAVGRRAESYDQPSIRRIARDAEANGHRMTSFILGVVRSDGFRLKRVDAATATTDTAPAPAQGVQHR